MLFYPESDICYMYRHAANKKAQIKILAEMNVTSSDEIVDLLRRKGIEVDIKIKEK
jgi:hypothetical protein